MKGIIALARKLHEIAEGEMVDDVGKLKAELQEAQMLFEMDEIVEEEYARREKEILKRLDALQNHPQPLLGKEGTIGAISSPARKVEIYL